LLKALIDTYPLWAYTPLSFSKQLNQPRIQGGIAMPQIFIISRCLCEQTLLELGSLLFAVVEKGFAIEGTNDVSCTVISSVRTLGEEADVQIEIRYTAGQIKYGRKTPFDPTLEEQKRLAEAIKPVVDDFLSRCVGRSMSLSVWCKPFYNSHFQIWKKE